MCVCVRCLCAFYVTLIYIIDQNRPIIFGSLRWLRHFTDRPTQNGAAVCSDQNQGGQSGAVHEAHVPVLHFGQRRFVKIQVQVGTFGVH